MDSSPFHILTRAIIVKMNTSSNQGRRRKTTNKTHDRLFRLNLYLTKRNYMTTGLTPVLLSSAVTGQSALLLRNSANSYIFEAMIT